MRIKMLLSGLILFFSSFITLQAQIKQEVNSKEVSEMLQKDTKLVVLDARTVDCMRKSGFKT